MSGPPYPHPDPAGNNGIGQFIIGVSPIGTIPTFDPWSTVISQYGNSPRIGAMVTSFNAAIDQTQNMESLYDLIWNVETAVGYGLDVWGRIVGISRSIEVPGTAEYFGFKEANSWTGFGQGIFYSGGGISSTYLLSDDEYRLVILAKAADKICNGSIQAINQILLNLFPQRGNCYVADNQDMSLTYTFEFVLTPLEILIVNQTGVLPAPAGIIVNVSHY